MARKHQSALRPACFNPQIGLRSLPTQAELSCVLVLIYCFNPQIGLRSLPTRLTIELLAGVGEVSIPKSGLGAFRLNQCNSARIVLYYCFNPQIGLRSLPTVSSLVVSMRI